MSLVEIDTVRLEKHINAESLTQKELAVKSGVSRSQLVRLLKSAGRKKVRAATAEGLANALRVRLSDLCDDDELEQYRRVVAEEFSRVCFRGLGIPWALQQRINDLFVDPKVYEVLGESCERAERRPRSTVQGVKRTHGFRGADAIKATDCVRLRDRVVLLGDPGSGKTTILKYLAYSAAVSPSQETALPIHIRVSEFAQLLESAPGLDPLTFVSAWAASRDCGNREDAFRKRLKSRRSRCLVFFDGLDEVGDERLYELAVSAIVRFIRSYPRNTFVLTSRPIGYSHDTWTHLGFSAYHIEDYDEDEQTQLIVKWSSILGRNGHETEETLAALTRAIFSNPRVRTLTTNPLILTICVLLHHARGGSLPRRRVDLYEKISDVFLDTWESSKASTNVLNELQSAPLDAREFGWLLRRLALAMQKAGRVAMPRWWVDNLIREYLITALGFRETEAGRASDAILRYLSERSGLLVEQGTDVFAFFHRTVQEYFASLGVIDEADASESRSISECLAEHIYHPDWSEVVRLAAAQLGPAMAERLVRRILDDPDPAGRFLRRGPLLALRCLADGTTVASRQLTTELFESLKSLGESRWLGLTFEAMSILDRFAGTRLEPLAEETADAIIETAHQTLTDGEFRQLHQFRNRFKIMDAARTELNEELSSWAMQSVTILLDEIQYRSIFFNCALQGSDAEAWLQSASLMLADEQLDDHLGNALVDEMGRWAQSSDQARDHLKGLATSDLPPLLRSACIHVLPRSSGTHSFVRRLLRNQDEDSIVRGACAASLKNAASEHKVVANELLGLLEPNAAEPLREGAARGLGSVVTDCPNARVALLRIASSRDEPEQLRIACAWSLSNAIGSASEVKRLFYEWLSNGSVPILRRIAAQALATAIAENRLEWDCDVVREVENYLMQLPTPCPEALDSLKMLVLERQSRISYRLEAIIRQALEPLAAQIALAFVFGSVARNQQGPDSDVDLFVLGHVSLRELSHPLREVENSLGRRINPVIYSRESFREKTQAGDPFLLDITRRQKIPIVGPGTTPTVQEVNDELRAMAAERLASAK